MGSIGGGETANDLGIVAVAHDLRSDKSGAGFPSNYIDCVGVTKLTPECYRTWSSS